jgi:stage II sporulation protein P
MRLWLELQNRMELDYPGLARPLYLSPARYNQHLSPGSFLLGVGTEANTLQEAKNAVRLFADCLAAVLETHRETG